MVVAEDHGEHEEEVPYDEEGDCMAGGCQLLWACICLYLFWDNIGSRLAFVYVYFGHITILTYCLLAYALFAV